MENKYGKIGPKIYELIAEFDLIEQLGILELVKNISIRTKFEMKNDK